MILNIDPDYDSFENLRLVIKIIEAKIADREVKNEQRRKKSRLSAQRRLNAYLGIRAIVFW